MEGLHHCETFLKGTEIWFQSKRRQQGFPSHLCIRAPLLMCFIKATFCLFFWRAGSDSAGSGPLDLTGKIRALSGADTCTRLTCIHSLPTILLSLYHSFSTFSRGKMGLNRHTNKSYLAAATVLQMARIHFPQIQCRCWSKCTRSMYAFK